MFEGDAGLAGDVSESDLLRLRTGKLKRQQCQCHRQKMWL
jgi:hypothetical protein